MEKIMILSTPEEIAKGLEILLRQHLKPIDDPYSEIERMDRRKAAKFLNVSYQTMSNWTKAGVIKEHGHGRKKFYLRQELIESLKNNV